MAGNFYIVRLRKLDGTIVEYTMESIDDQRALFDAERAFNKKNGLQIRRDLTTDYPIIEEIDPKNKALQMEETK